ncbi:MAG: hypothetical protein ACAH21_11985 [Ramlibacter sp.]|nr:hypothetical protein [Ramlibacter sp.]
MIQLANDPAASRAGSRAPEEQAKAQAFDARRSRTGHAWPFPSRYAQRPARQESQKPAASDSGS